MWNDAQLKKRWDFYPFHLLDLLIQFTFTYLRKFLLIELPGSSILSMSRNCSLLLSLWDDRLQPCFNRASDQQVFDEMPKRYKTSPFSSECGHSVRRGERRRGEERLHGIQARERASWGDGEQRRRSSPRNPRPERLAHRWCAHRRSPAPLQESSKRCCSSPARAREIVGVSARI